MLAHPQTLARDMVVETHHRRIGKVPALGVPLRFSQTKGEVTRSAPVLGEHTREVLAEYDYTTNEIENLIKEGTVGAA